MATRLALELAAGGDLVSVKTAAARAHRSAIRLRPAELAEHGISLVLASAIDFLEAQGAGGG